MGHALPWRQQDLEQRGHAIECRVYAEDPGAGFLPQAGPLLLYREPAGPGIRVDSGVEEGSEVGVHYDPMLAKLIAWGQDRDACIARAMEALKRFPVLGVRTNIEFLLRTLDHPEFRRGRTHTGFIDQHLADLLKHEPAADAVFAAAAAATAPAPGAPAAQTSVVPDPWSSMQGWGR
jgi:acetyl/propionyl-CoA carboxylase alpha subunit